VSFGAKIQKRLVNCFKYLELSFKTNKQNITIILQIRFIWKCQITSSKMIKVKQYNRSILNRSSYRCLHLQLVNQISYISFSCILDVWFNQLNIPYLRIVWNVDAQKILTRNIFLIFLPIALGLNYMVYILFSNKSINIFPTKVPFF
jgi:hypothetical protein